MENGRCCIAKNTPPRVKHERAARTHASNQSRGPVLVNGYFGIKHQIDQLMGRNQTILVEPN